MSILLGSGNYGYVPYTAQIDSLITNSLTICSWVNVTTAGAMQMIVNREVNATPGNEWYSLNLSSQAPRALIGNATSVTNVNATTPVALSLNQWYFLAMVWTSAGAITLYQDGVQLATGTRAISMGTDATGIFLGANAQGPNDSNVQEFFLGYLEDCRMYNRALSVNELLTIQNSKGRDGINNGLVLGFKFDEGSEGSTATVFKDIGPYGLHATANGSCIYGPSRLLSKSVLHN